MMSQKTVQFLPFNAINQWMRPDYREGVVSGVLQNLDSFESQPRSVLLKWIRQVVKVPGFRNSSQAPVQVLLRPAITGFEKHAQLTAVILSSWAYLQADLRQKVYQLLVDRDWELLPPEADRTHLPGFLTSWPKNEDFSVINAAMSEKFPEDTFNPDDVSLMTVWLSGRVPLDMEEG